MTPTLDDECKLLPPDDKFEEWIAIDENLEMCAPVMKLDAKINQQIWIAAAAIFKLNRRIFLDKEVHPAARNAVYKSVNRTILQTWIIYKKDG